MTKDFNLIKVKKGQAPRYQRDRITSYLLISETTVKAKELTVTLVEMEAGGRQHIHSHKNEQAYYILEGQGKMTVADAVFDATAGDCVYIPAWAKHGLENVGGSKLRYLSEASPVFGEKQEKELWPLPAEDNCET